MPRYLPQPHGMKPAIERASWRNFHLPLPDTAYRALREAAARERVPATLLARRAIESWLAETRKAAVHEAIAAYAAHHAGTDVDLDAELAAASLETWRSPKRRRR